MQHPENRLWKLLALKLSGDATPDELCELNSFLEVSSDEKNIADSIEMYWNQKNDLVNSNDETEEERFHFILNADNNDNACTIALCLTEHWPTPLSYVLFQWKAICQEDFRMQRSNLLQAYPRIVRRFHLLNR